MQHQGRATPHTGGNRDEEEGNSSNFDTGTNFFHDRGFRKRRNGKTSKAGQTGVQTGKNEVSADERRGKSPV